MLFRLCSLPSWPPSLANLPPTNVPVLSGSRIRSQSTNPFIFCHPSIHPSIRQVDPVFWRPWQKARSFDIYKTFKSFCYFCHKSVFGHTVHNKYLKAVRVRQEHLQQQRIVQQQQKQQKQQQQQQQKHQPNTPNVSIFLKSV